ncbi:MAG: hypothetical protein JOS17DRAFT_728230 [Linnemannia elongata]|nr:MAG: hypothetical protein JOS17DRAFT_728230 [Linnemannia elongata]
MSRNPYFAHLPTRHNRQDLVFALDSLPRLLTSTSTSPSSNDTQSPCPSLPGSPCSPYATFTGSFYPSWSNMSTSSTSSSSSTSSCSSISSFYQQQYQQRLIQRHVRRSYSCSSNKMSTLQFSTRAQAMGFLINLLQSFQQEPCECDLVQGCFCSPEGVEDHSGLAPCYVCGEWYAEEVYCSGDEGDSSSYTKVDGRSWHERGGASLRHQVAETRVKQWLEQVVVPVASAASWSSSPYYYQQQQQQQQSRHYQQDQQHDEKKEQQTQQQPAVIRSRPSRSASCPATFSIPEEIMDPTTRRTPGFCIKRRDTIATERPASLPSSPVVEQLPATSYSAPSSASSTLTNSKSTPFRFSFTSERFNSAVQESLSRRSSTTSITSTTATSGTAVVPQQQSLSSNVNTNNYNTKDIQAEAVAEQQTGAELGMEAETATETEEEAARVADTETASTSAHTTPSSFFVSSPSFSSSRGCSPSSSTAAGKIDHRDQYGVAKEPYATASSVVAQQPSSTLSSSASLGTSTGAGTRTTFSTFSFGKSQLDTPRAVTPTTTGTPPPPQAQHHQEAGRDRARRRGHGHVRQLAQSHILVTGSSLHHSLFSQLQQKESEPGETSDPMVVMSPPFSHSSSSSPLPPRSARSQQHGLLTASSPPLMTTTPPSIRKKKTVSFSLPLPLPLPRIVITPPSPTSPTLTEGRQAVAEWQSCCNTPSSHLNTNTNNNNCDNNSGVSLPVNPRQQSTSLPVHTYSGSSSALLLLATTRLVQTVFQSAITLGWWWSCSSLSGILFNTFPFPSVTSSPCT